MRMMVYECSPRAGLYDVQAIIGGWRNKVSPNEIRFAETDVRRQTVAILRSRLVSFC